MVSTYEKTEFESISLGGQNTSEIARAAYDLSFERPVCAAAALSLSQGNGEKSNGFDLAVYNPK
jgi:IMP cyclohydrolase